VPEGGQRAESLAKNGENEMQTLKMINPETASPKTRQLLGTFEQLRGRSSNMLRVMAQSPAILEAYLNFNRAFEQTRMPTKLRGFISIAIAEILGCEYMLSIAAAIGVREGFTSEELEAARKATSRDTKIAQALRFVTRMVEQQGRTDASDIAALHEVGYSDEEIVEIIGAISLNLFRNYFNLAVQTVVDSPLVTAARPSPDLAAR
jgi:alkylhydroperoxidase family enzyme